MSNNDTELFDLCKAVYEVTGWEYGKDDLSLWVIMNDNGIYSSSPYIVDNCCWLETDADLIAPLYTSDYLLEKLREEYGKYVSVAYHAPSKEIATALKPWDDKYVACNASMPQGEYPIGDKPVIPLLKLTLKLHEKGLLDHE